MNRTPGDGPPILQPVPRSDFCNLWCPHPRGSSCGPAFAPSEYPTTCGYSSWGPTWSDHESMTIPRLDSWEPLQTTLDPPAVFPTGPDTQLSSPFVSVSPFSGDSFTSLDSHTLARPVHKRAPYDCLCHQENFDENKLNRPGRLYRPAPTFNSVQGSMSTAVTKDRHGR